jgi:hypothetical protein
MIRTFNDAKLEAQGRSKLQTSETWGEPSKRQIEAERSNLANVETWKFDLQNDESLRCKAAEMSK